MIEEFEKYKNRMCNIMRISEDTFLHDHHYPMPYARIIVADALRNMGYKWESIGKMLQKSHSNLVMMCRKMNEIKDQRGFRQVGILYKEFHKDEDYVRD